ncbi:MAG: hypothetical protein RMI56_02695 [Sulfolobales archaeon]|nr:hypothetical protein [Sulfolobales archaeon]MDW8082687.1 hypothetical protein [Sulfolobales archaeon]
MIVIRLSDGIAEILNRLADEFEKTTGRRPSYDELVETLLSKLDVGMSSSSDIWF